MSCESSCGPLVVTLLTGAPGLQGPEGPQGPQGPPGSLTSITGDLSLAAGQTETVATVVGIRGKTVVQQAPSINQLYQFNGTSWEPVSYTAGTY
jgi:hypothetical protein